MSNYLKAIVLEQKDRALCLKNMIHPIRYQELSGLAERCTIIIDGILSGLGALQQELDNPDQNDSREIMRKLRRRAREIQMVESQGISVLSYINDDIRYMNDLIFLIHNEINLPLPRPSVACICAPTTTYYSFHPFTNVIFVPVGEARFLLHLPDAFHELGHYVLFSRENTLRLKEIGDRYDIAIKRITEHYQELVNKKSRDTGPASIIDLLKLIHYQWKEYWINEFFCDLFALYTLGPAYAWAHVHLTIKTSEDVYEFSKMLPQSHPSDDSRMRMLIIGLNRLGFSSEAKLIFSKWNDIPAVNTTEPLVEYQYAYPAKLMEEIADLFLTGLREGNFEIISPDKLEKMNPDSVVKTLNEAWSSFWNNPEEYRSWEEKCIEKLKHSI